MKMNLIVVLLVSMRLLVHATEVMKLSNGYSVDVVAYESTLRVRLYPSDRSNLYGVNDVIVMKEMEPQPVPVCTDGCVVSIGPMKLQLKEAGSDLLGNFFVNEQELSKFSIHHIGSERTEGSFEFPLAERLYGLPEHAVDLTLQGGKTYRLMNLDVFQYKLDDTGGIYGTIPFLMAHSTTSPSTGMLWLNSADSNVDISSKAAGGSMEAAKFSSEVGMHDFFLFAGGTPDELQQQHSKLTGPVFFPPLFSLGYHQCRWNYRSTADSLDVDNGFDTHNIPYDVLWLDIEHTDGKRYFTWDLHNFPEPQKLIESIASKGRKMVTITDPHIKRDSGYHVHNEATSKGFYVKNEAGGDYEGHCWPGTSSWIDFFNKDARDWYATLFKYDRYGGSTPDLYSWIDMNEPSVFNSHEVTMDKNAVHHSADGKAVAHRYLHNMYGFYHTMAAFQGHILRNSEPPRQVTRPFILTRSFFAGSQRYAAMWTGDNMADWSHLVKSIPMLLTLSISNFPFVGADVGGFFNNPSPSLLVRWYQAAVFYPFFRGHAHLETKRREPWLFGDDNTKLIRDAIAIRYALLPYIYSNFYNAHTKGTSIIRPMFYEFPHQSRFLDEQEAYMFGPALLVRPVTAEQLSSVTVPLPESEVWYEFPVGKKVEVPSYYMAVTMETIPMFLRGGYILPVKERLRRSSAAMKNDPVTLYVGLNRQGNANGELYFDDGISYEFEKGSCIHQQYTFTDSNLKAQSVAGCDMNTIVMIEKIVIFGLSKPPGSVSIRGADGMSVALNFQYSDGSVTVRRPAVSVRGNWVINFN